MGISGQGWGGAMDLGELELLTWGQLRDIAAAAVPALEQAREYAVSGVVADAAETALVRIGAICALDDAAERGQ